MKFKIKDEIFKKFPELVVGVIVTKGIENAGEDAAIDQMLRNVEEKVKDEFSGLEAPTRHQNIICWREVYKKFGSDPHQYRCSSEALVRQVLKGNTIRHINKLVDIYNFISLKYVLTVGGEDLDKLKGDLVLDFAQGTELFVRLGGTENESPDQGEVVYKDDEGAICRRWNWREGDRTKLTEKTKSSILVIEGIPPITSAQVENAMAELAELIEKFCGGHFAKVTLNSERREMGV